MGFVLNSVLREPFLVVHLLWFPFRPKQKGAEPQTTQTKCLLGKRVDHLGRGEREILPKGNEGATQRRES